LMCKAFHGRSGLHPMMLPQGLKCLARQNDSGEWRRYTSDFGMIPTKNEF
jgi:hypothetical protein